MSSTEKSAELIGAERLPVIVTKNFVLFPGRTVPLAINRRQSVEALNQSMLSHQGRVIVVAQKRETADGASIVPDDLNRVGVVARIEQKTGDSKRGYQLIIHGIERIYLRDVRAGEGSLYADYDKFPDSDSCDEPTRKALLANAKILAQEILQLIPADTSQIESVLQTVHDINAFVSVVIENIDITLAQKQDILEVDGEKNRILRVLEFMADQKRTLEIQADVRSKLNEKIGKHQREVILREQLKTIRDELGDSKSEGDEDYFRKIEEAGLPEHVRSIALDEARRLAAAGSSNPEAHMIKNYIDLLLALPWSRSTEDVIDLEAARAVLDGDHFGLEKVKKRIIQHLAVMKLKKDKKGSILLFVGPPGVGKTSLGESIARSLGRKFIRSALGGVRDDAEIRGHRKTYIGAMPGRIIQSIKRAGVNNPVFLLDEIDKLGRGMSGDPAAALLEVLDPEQNREFHDHYLDVPFDLSRVFFIATANSLEGIPGPLLDRMEIIDLSGYVMAEKLAIAKTYLVPKQTSEHGLSSEQLVITDSALIKLITGYTREAGVRNLQRQIQALCRYAAEKIAGETILSVIIGVDQVTEALGAERYSYEDTSRIAPAGVVTGLAWTPVGGDVLFVEAAQMPGTGRLILTGQLGDVMKESAQIAVSLVRSHLAAFLKVGDFEKRDIHIHVPSGAIPKDGPSAGVTMLTTIASLLTGMRVSPKLAMTGEITLRGKVTPVGGIKEKILAAHRSGVEHVLIPRENQKDLNEIPVEVLAEIKVTTVDHINEVLEIALGIHDAFLPQIPAGHLPAADGHLVV